MKIACNSFGSCPECGGTDGYLNVGKTHVFFCAKHKAKWLAGTNLFSSWQDETEAEQRKKYDEAGLGGFREVEPLPEGTPVFEAGLCLEAITHEVRQYAGRIVSAGLAAIRKAGDDELHYDPSSLGGDFIENVGMDAVAAILLDAIRAEIKRREKQPNVHMLFGEKCPPWLHTLVQDAATAGVNQSRGGPDIGPKDGSGDPF